MLIPSLLNLSGFTSDEISLIKTVFTSELKLITEINQMWSYKTKYLFIYLMEKLKYNINFTVPYYSINDPFYNCFLEYTNGRYVKKDKKDIDDMIGYDSLKIDQLILKLESCLVINIYN